jgi:Mg-chelatase subunit ChlD
LGTRFTIFVKTRGKEMNTRVVTIAAALMAAAAWAYAAPAPSGAGGTAAARPRIEVAFVLDSTGSMGGLIEGAKSKIWSIANSIIAGKPTPDVKIGLLTYRDRGDEYVTKRFDLTADIDTVFANLQSFQAGGGGDGEESVNQALRETVGLMSWSKDSRVVKIVFLVGDYPPHMDYANDVKYQVTCKEAATRGIVINTVQCGSVEETTPVWREIARLAEGSYVALSQNGNMQAVSTPYDEEIASLGAELSSTLVAYGERARQEEVKEKAEKAASAPAAVAADRATYNLASGGKAVQGSGDLVDDLINGAAELNKIPVDQLPPDMQSMTPAERKAYVESQSAAREALNKKLAVLVEKRNAFLQEETVRLAASGSGDSFDLKVAEIIAAEAARQR